MSDVSEEYAPGRWRPATPVECTCLHCRLYRFWHRKRVKPVPETNRDKVLQGRVVLVTNGRLREMQQQAIRLEGVGDGTYHWHWAAVINELIARREGTLE